MNIGALIAPLTALGLLPRGNTPPVGGGFRGIVAALASDQSSITWPYLPTWPEILDTDNAYNPATGIITVPAGVTMMKFSYAVRSNAVNTAAGIFVSMVDSDSLSAVGGLRAAASKAGYNDFEMTGDVPWTPVTPGTQLRFRINVNSTNYNQLLANSRFVAEFM